MQLSPDRPRTRQQAQDRRLIANTLSPAVIQRGAAVEAAFVICGGISADEVFVSDVLDVAAFLLVDDVPDASIVCGMRDGELECCLNEGHISIAIEGIHTYGHVTSTGAVFDEEVPF